MIIILIYFPSLYSQYDSGESDLDDCVECIMAEIFDQHPDEAPIPVPLSRKYAASSNQPAQRGDKWRGRTRKCDGNRIIAKNDGNGSSSILSCWNTSSNQIYTGFRQVGHR